MLSIHAGESPSSTVAPRPQPGLGWVSLGLALLVHAVVAALLLAGHDVTPDAQPALEVTLVVAPVEPPAPPVAAPAEADLPPPASDPEPPPTLPDPQAIVPASSPSADGPAPAVPTPVAARHPARPIARPARRPPVVEPSPSAAQPAAPIVPVVPAYPPPAASPLQQPSAEAAGAWRNAMAAWLRDHRTYPDMARRDGVEGRVVVRFTMDAAGLVTAVALVTSSGSAMLDDAAEALLLGAHLPPPPAPAPGHLTVVLPVRYSLAQ